MSKPGLPKQFEFVLHGRALVETKTGRDAILIPGEYSAFTKSWRNDGFVTEVHVTLKKDPRVSAAIDQATFMAVDQMCGLDFTKVIKKADAP